MLLLLHICYSCVCINIYLCVDDWFFRALNTAVIYTIFYYPIQSVQHTYVFDECLGKCYIWKLNMWKAGKALSSSLWLVNRSRSRFKFSVSPQQPVWNMQDATWAKAETLLITITRLNISEFKGPIKHKFTGKGAKLFPPSLDFRN